MTSAALKQPRDCVVVLGIPVDRVDMAGALEAIAAFVESGRPNIVVTADAQGIVIAQGDSQYRSILLQADLVTADSYGVLWAAKRAGLPLAERVSGVDLVDAICGLSAERGYRLFLLGGEPGVAEQAAERLRLRHPGCNIVGTRHGFFPPDSDSVVAAEIAERKPDVLFVGMGIPRQEKFIAASLASTGASVGMGVGGSFDVHSGKTRRAPRFVQSLRLEWLWRLILNPRKLAKAKALPKFVWLVIRHKN
jgi:N-acetylglucosaminyldiphosphoundecaprenol N-acetyl-beta-D-mannosaminyltransferase